MTVKLREYATKIRKSVEQNIPKRQLRVQKEEMLQEIYRILTICLGQPPSEFDWEYNDKAGKCHSVTGLTPTKFLKQVVGYPVSISLHHI